MTDGDQRQLPPAVAIHLDAQGVHARPVRQALALLAEDWRSLAELVRRTALPRRDVEDLLTALDDDLERRDDRYRVRPARAEVYRQPVASPEPPGLLGTIERDIADGPPPTSAMDHVPADADTVLHRARWLDEHYALSAARLLFLGDHDLTSLAVCALRPDVEVTVLDLDERVLEFVDARARERGLPVRCLHADLRFGLPPTVAEWADLVFSDPPYTPDGMALFAARGVEALREPERGRLLLAYGYSRRNPALGLKVQQELQRLGLVFEAILPAFHRYHGAQAIGSSAELYVCQPTARSRRAVVGRSGRTGIYTHGPQSIESRTALTDDLRDAVRTVAGTHGGAEFRVGEIRQPGWDRPLTGTPGEAVVVDLTADPGPWLLRTLLAGNADRVALLVPNNHPDLGSARGQTGLADLIAPHYRLRFLRSTPGPNHAVVLADAVPAVPESAAGALLRRAHGKLGNVWREALITASGGALTKNQARTQVAASTPPGVDLSARLIDLPRHHLTAVLAAAAPRTGDTP